MRIVVGGQSFQDVSIPLLWGERAILQDHSGRLSIIDLGGAEAVLEVIGDEPAPGIEFTPVEDGFKVLRDGQPLYEFDRGEKLITAVELRLPDCQVTLFQIRVGSSVLEGNLVIGSGVGFAVTEHGISMGAPLPERLAQLVVDY